MHDDGADGCWAWKDIEACGFEFGAGVLHVVFELLYALGFAEHDLDRGVRAGGDGDGKSVTKERWAAALNEQVDDLLACGDESTCAAAESFAERACEDVDTASV